MKEEYIKELNKLSHYLDYSNHCVQMCSLAVKVNHIAALIEIYKQSVLYTISLNGYKTKVDLLQKELEEMKEKLEEFSGLCVLNEEDYFEESVMNDLLNYCATVQDTRMSLDNFKEAMVFLPKLSEYLIDTYEKIDSDSSTPDDLMENIHSLSVEINDLIKNNELECSCFDMSQWDEDHISASFEIWMSYVENFSLKITTIMKAYVEEIENSLNNRESGN